MKTACEFNRELIREKTPEMSYRGGDYENWKRAAREKLTSLLGLDKFTKVDDDLDVEYETELDNALEIRFTFQSEKGYRVPAHLFIPKGAERPPVMICLQGHTTGMHISFARPKYKGDEEDIAGGDRDFCVRALKEGFAAVALEQRAMGETGEHDGRMCLQESLAALLCGRTTLGERVWDIMRLIDVIEKHFNEKTDVGKICCMGNSGGGTATAYAAALEDRIALAMPSCAMCTYKDSIGAMFHCACNYVPGIVNWFDMSDLLAMAYPKLYIQINGTEDKIFPISGAQAVFEKGTAVYKENGVFDRCVHIKGNGGHRFFADDAWPAVHKLLGGR